MDLTWHHQRFVLMGQRGLYWPDQKALLVADLHWGKDATFRAHGIPVSRDHLRVELERLVQLCVDTQAKQLWVLGDLVHSVDGFDASTLALIDAFLPKLPAQRRLIEGNHDRRLLERIRPWGFEIVSEPHPVAGLNLTHHPRIHERCISGHEHPTYVVTGARRQRNLRLPCFFVGQDQLTLPAFTGFSNGIKQRPTHGDQIYVIADSQVIRAF